MLRNRKGTTLVELMVAVTLTGLLTAVLYRTVMSQQQIYTVQDEVADMQQNLRVSLEKMTKEILNAGLGAADYGLPFSAGGGPYNFVINPPTPRATSTRAMTRSRSSAVLSKCPRCLPTFPQGHEDQTGRQCVPIQSRRI